MIDRKTSSRWMNDDFHSQLLRGKNLVLSGNVLDMVLLNGQYLSLPEFLNRYFQETGFQIVVWYDIVDGFRLANPDQMTVLFSQAIGPAAMGSGAGVSRGGSLFEHGDAGPSARSTTSGAATPPATTPGQPARPTAPQIAQPPAGRRAVVQTPEQILRTVRQLIRQTEIPSAVIIEFADKLFTDPKQQDESERQTLTLLKKITQEAAYLRQGPLEGRKNCLVLIAENLASIPPWLYQHNDALSLTQIPKPEADERRHFITHFYGNFHEGNLLSEAEPKEIFEPFVDNTDGLSLRDLDTMYRMSKIERLSIREPKKLIRQFKFGRQENAWDKFDPAKIEDARPRLERRVIGQPHAIKAVVNMLECAVGGISLSGLRGKGGQPRVLLCCGPTGVGKTELAKALAEFLFGDESAMAPFDMTEYMQEHSDQRLIGPPPGFVGHEEGGQLTNRCFKRPDTFFLFDEFEKAAPRILDLFLQILEDGRLTDGRGKTAFFSESVLMFTSNIGGSTLDAHLYQSGGELPDYETICNHYMKAVRRRFKRKIGRPELLNRFGGNIVAFDIVRPEHVPAICHKFFALGAASAKERYGVRLEFDHSIVEMICRLMLQRENFEMGGRKIKALLEELVLPAVNRWVPLMRRNANELVTVSAQDGRILINGDVVN